MTDDYIKSAMRTCSNEFHDDLVSQLTIHAAMGMVTESAEFMDGLKKAIFYGKPIDKINLVEELGDLMWYVAVACHELDVSIQDICEVNILKLMTRYPDKFTQKDANNRDLPTERETLEMFNYKQQSEGAPNEIKKITNQ